MDKATLEIVKKLADMRQDAETANKNAAKLQHEIDKTEAGMEFNKQLEIVKSSKDWAKIHEAELRKIGAADFLKTGEKTPGYGTGKTTYPIVVDDETALIDWIESKNLQDESLVKTVREEKYISLIGFGAVGIRRSDGVATFSIKRDLSEYLDAYPTDGVD